MQEENVKIQHLAISLPCKLLLLNILDHSYLIIFMEEKTPTKQTLLNFTFTNKAKKFVMVSVTVNPYLSPCIIQPTMSYFN